MKVSTEPITTKVSSLPNEGEVARRGGVNALKALRDAESLFDPEQEKTWGVKYRFFSELKMKGTYRTFAKARHDPFNKDPSWNDYIFSRLADICQKQGTQAVFTPFQEDRDKKLSRSEMKDALLSVLPTLSNLEVTAIFDAIDTDRSNDVTWSELIAALAKGRNAVVEKEHADRWRNPVHRIKRMSPAVIDGWSHLEADPGMKPVNIEKVCEQETKGVLERLDSTLRSTPRALVHTPNIPRYAYFGGGGDEQRFRRLERAKARAGASADGTVLQEHTLDLPDPGGPDLRPGFLLDPRNRQSMALKGFSALTPRPSSRR